MRLLRRPCGLVDRRSVNWWGCRLMDLWTKKCKLERVGTLWTPWTCGRCGPVDLWTCGSVDSVDLWTLWTPWTCGPVDLWTCGLCGLCGPVDSVDLWTLWTCGLCGPVDSVDLCTWGNGLTLLFCLVYCLLKLSVVPPFGNNLGKLCIETEVIYLSVMTYTVLRYLQKQPKNWLRVQDIVDKTLRQVRISFLISAIQRVLRFFSGKLFYESNRKIFFLCLLSLI